MNPDTTVSIHPYFRPHEGKFDEFVAGFDAFVERTSSEEKVLFYNFTTCNGVVFCREAYEGAEAALNHLENVGDLLQAALAISDLERLEIHGAEAELTKMKEPLADLPVEWFVLKAGLKK